MFLVVRSGGLEIPMSQHNVERIIGLLATDEGVRGRFRKDPRATLQELLDRGFELNDCEFSSLVALDAREIARFARALDPRLQKIDLRGDGPWKGEPS